MNRLPAKFHLEGYIVGGKRITDTYASGGVLLYRDREITLKNKKTRRITTVTENQLRQAFEKTEAYLHSLPFADSLDVLKKRIEAGLAFHPGLTKPVSADGAIWLLDNLYNGETVDCRPPEIRESREP